MMNVQSLKKILGKTKKTFGNKYDDFGFANFSMKSVKQLKKQCQNVTQQRIKSI